MSRMFWVVLMVWIAAGQTQIDLNTQAKNVPIKAGASLPTACTVGQIFFLTSASTGTNLYGCTAVNTWSAQGGQPGAGAIMHGTRASMPTTCTVGQTYFATDASAGANLYGCSAANTWTAEGGSETVDSNGVTIGSRPITNFLTGAGLISVITDTGAEINIQSALDTAVVATLPAEQTGSSLLCSSASGSGTTYGCSMTPTATAYSLGMVLHWIPDVHGAGGATTLNVDSLGAKSIKRADGVSDPSATDIVASSMQEVWYDGTNFRFLAAGSGQTSGDGTGSGPVQSVFGRTGAVVAAPGDYTAQQVTNAAATNSSNTFTAGTQEFAGAAHTRPTIVVSSYANLPSTCAVGELAFVSGALAGQQIYECSEPNTWIQQSGGSGGGGVAAAPVFNIYANRPACNSAATGVRFFASDISNKEWQCDGITWQPIAFGMQVVEPAALPWTAVTGGSDNPTIANVGGTVQLSGLQNAGSGLESMGMTTPLVLSPPYTVEVAFTLQLLTSTSTWYNSSCYFGVASGAPSASTWEGMHWLFSAGGAAMTLLEGGGAFNASVTPRTSLFNALAAQPVIRAAISDDGTHRTFYISTGSGWMQLYQESDTTGISSPGYWGLGCQTYDPGDQFQLTLYHASVHH